MASSSPLPQPEIGPSRLQVAFALAVVRSKPEGITVRAYILHLREHLRQGKQIFTSADDHHHHLDQVAYWKARHKESEQRCQELERRNVQLERWRLSDAANSGMDVIVIEDEPFSRPGSRAGTPRPSTPRPRTPRPGTPGGSKRKAMASNPNRSPKRIKHSSSDVAELSVMATREQDKVDTSHSHAADDSEVDKTRETLLQKLHLLHKLYKQETTKPEAICFNLVETARAIGGVVATIPRHYDRLAMGNLKGLTPLEKDRSELSSVLQSSTRAWASLTVGLKKLSDVIGSHLPSLVIFECVKMFRTVLDSVSEAAQQIARSRFHNQSKSSKSRMDTSTTPRDTGPFRAVAQFVNTIMASLSKDDRHHRQIFEGVLYLLIDRVGKLLFYFTFDSCRSETIQGDITISQAGDDKRDVARQTTEATATRLEAQCLVPMLDRAMGLAPHHMNSPLGSCPSSSTSRRGSSTAQSTPTKSLARARAPLVARAQERLQRTLIQSMFGDEEHDEFADVLRMPGTLGPMPRITKMEDDDVGDWFNGEVWKLVGWNLLSKDAEF